MKVTRAHIKKWFHEGRAQKATHMCIMCDWFDDTYYPIYLNDGEPFISNDKVIATHKIEGSNIEELLKEYK